MSDDLLPFERAMLAARRNSSNEEAMMEKTIEAPVEKIDVTAGEVPDALKKNQFTSKDNPNPKGSDADGDGKKNEEKPWDKKKKARLQELKHRLASLRQLQEFLLEEYKRTASTESAEKYFQSPTGALEHDSDEPYMAEHFDLAELSELGDREEAGDLEDGVADGKKASAEMISLEADLDAALGKRADFDPKHIGEKEKGPHEHDKDESNYMGGQFTQEQNTELHDKQESGSLPTADKQAGSAPDTVQGWIEWQE